MENEIKEFLKGHEGLRLLNNKRKEEAITKSVENEEPLDVLQELINDDPTLAALFGTGTKLKTPYGKEKIETPFNGHRSQVFKLRKTWLRIAPSTGRAESSSRRMQLTTIFLVAMNQDVLK